MSAVLVVNSMKAVSPNSLLEPFVGPWIYRRRKGHPMMKRGIENCHLRNVAQKTFHNLYTFEFRSIVKRSRVGDARDSAFHLFVDDHRLIEFVPSEDNAMPHSSDFTGFFDDVVLSFPQ